MNWYKISQKMDANAFCRGYCTEFAIALHRLTGWPIVVFNEVVKEDDEYYFNLVHVAVKSPSGKYVDVRGARTEQEIANNLLKTDATPLKDYKIESVSEEDLYAATEVNEVAIEEAEFFISKNHKLLGIDK